MSFRQRSRSPQLPREPHPPRATKAGRWPCWVPDGEGPPGRMLKTQSLLKKCPVPKRTENRQDLYATVHRQLAERQKRRRRPASDRHSDAAPAHGGAVLGRLQRGMARGPAAATLCLVPLLRRGCKRSPRGPQACAIVPRTVSPGQGGACPRPSAPSPDSPHWVSSSPLGQFRTPSHHCEAVTQVPEEPHSIPDTEHLSSTCRDGREMSVRLGNQRNRNEGKNLPP